MVPSIPSLGDYKTHKFVIRKRKKERKFKKKKKTCTQAEEFTHLVKSSEHIASQRFSEEFFLRIPLKAFGGLGKFGR